MLQCKGICLILEGVLDWSPVLARKTKGMYLFYRTSDIYLSIRYELTITTVRPLLNQIGRFEMGCLRGTIPSRSLTTKSDVLKSYFSLTWSRPRLPFFLAVVSGFSTPLFLTNTSLVRAYSSGWTAPMSDSKDPPTLDSLVMLRRSASPVGPREWRDCERRLRSGLEDPRGVWLCMATTPGWTETFSDGMKNS